MTKKTFPIKLPQKIKADYEHYCRQLHKWSVAYYQNNTSLVADEHYDKVLQKVSALEKAYPVLQTDDSPTQQVGSPVVQSHFQKHQHLYQMLSLSNIFAKDEIASFVTKTAAMITDNYDLNYVGELKIDGLAISLEYENYELKTASTRGDGKVGEDVTLNIYAIKNIPHKIKVPRLVVRGEIYLSKKAFQHLNEIQQTKQEPLYANARNAAAGTLRNLNVAVVAERNLEAFFYDCHSNETLTSQAELLSFLQAQGFCVNPHYQVLKSVAEMEHYAAQQETKRDHFPYAIDGVVFKLNQLEARSQVGVTSKFPKWATAYKFAAVYATTKVTNIKMTVGRTGRINYIASLEPVNLLGTTVSKATLHNYDFIAKKDLRVGDIVQVYKAGEIIPEIAHVLSKQRKEDLRKFVKGKTCPSCGSVLVQPENEVDQYCVNAACQTQQIKAISHFASRNAIDIRGLSEQIITKLWHAGFVKSFLDLYNLEQQRDALMALSNMGMKSVDNLLDAINNSVHQSPAKLLYALGIKHVGLRTATLLIEHFQSLPQLADASVETLSHLKNIGSEIATSVADFFHQAQQNDLLGQLTKIGFNLTVKTQVGQLAQQKFVFTGSLQKPRSYYNKLLETQGAVVQNQVTKTTNYVVIGAKPGSKARVAQQKKIAVLTEEDLCHLLKVNYEKKD